MIFTETKLKGAFIVEIEKQEDARGFFARTWCAKEFFAQGLKCEFVQSNTAFNKIRGTLRGLHYQVVPYEEIKLVQCTSGAIFDVMVDLRPGSPTYKHWVGIDITANNHRMLYVPAGVAHGYQTIVDNTVVSYRVSEFFSPEAERGIRWDDPLFKIKWPEPVPRMISEKDKHWPDYSWQGTLLRA